MPAGNKPKAQPPTEPTLLELARKKFATLSRAEEELFRAVQEGRDASALTDDEKEDDPANAANWNADRVVRAESIAWLCTDPQASTFVTYRGLSLVGMRIDAELDLNDAEIKFSLRAWGCAFLGNILLRDAQLAGLYFLRCHIKGLDAYGARIARTVLLSKLKAIGAVNLSGATIGGDLICNGTQLSDAKGNALDARSAKIGGSVFLSCKAEGEVRFAGAAIGGNLEFNCAAKLLNAKGKALDAESAKIEGSVFFHLGVKVVGKVNLLGTTIGGTLVYSGLVEPKKAILDLRSASVGTLSDEKRSWPSAGKLFLDGFNYDRLFEESPLDAKSRIEWLHRQRPKRTTTLAAELAEAIRLEIKKQSFLRRSYKRIIVVGRRIGQRLTSAAGGKNWVSAQTLTWRELFLPQPYEQLASVLRKMGHERDARLIMIEKNRDRARFTRFFQQGWWWYNVFGRLIGYGYAPWRAFAMSVVMILLGWILFYLGFSHDLVLPTRENAYAKAPNGQFVLDNSGRPKILEDYPAFNAFVYSLESFIPLIKFDQSANWTPNANRRTEISGFHLHVPFTGRFLRYYLYCHIAAGWILTSLWVGAVTGLVKS